MKNYRKWIPIVLALLVLGSWYKMYSDRASTKGEYESYLAEARKHAANGVTKFAIANYTAALEIIPSEEIYGEVAEYYLSQNDAAGYVTWVEDFHEKYPTSSLAYDYLVRGYMNDEMYDDVYDVLDEAEKRGVSSEYMRSVKEEIYYMYSMGFAAYEDVGIFSSNLCAVMSDGKWGFVNRYGELRISCKYSEVGVYTSRDVVPVINSQGKPYFIDKTGSKVIASNETFLRFGNFAGDLIPAQKADGKYVYLDGEMNTLFGGFEYAGTMNGGIAAVQDKGQWRLINSQGEFITEQGYEDIKLDGKQICYRNDRIFAKIGEKYAMLDGSGRQIGTRTFEDAMPFLDSTYAAVKIDSKWTFIDKDGNLYGDKYEEARSYANGFAAVRIAGKWGYINLEGKVVIEPSFYGAIDFNEKGSCFVKTGEEWQLLKIYRLNRGG